MVSFASLEVAINLPMQLRRSIIIAAATIVIRLAVIKVAVITVVVVIVIAAVVRLPIISEPLTGQWLIITAL